MSQLQSRILSIDGGGIRGILPATLLADIEKRTGRPICQLFDVLAGTSTGGIIALGLTMEDPNTPGQPKYSAQDLLGLYTQKGGEIFKKSLLVNPMGLFGKLYQHQGLEKQLLHYFGAAELRHALKPIVVTAYDIQQRKPFYFTSRLAAMEPDKENFLLRDVARCTSAAPTYFEPSLVSNKIGDSFSLVDGGVCANNPSLLGYSESIDLRREARFKALQTAPSEGEELASRGTGARPTKELNPSFAPDSVLLSLGTGNGLKPYHFHDATGWGALKWTLPIVDILMQGSSEAMHNQMEYVLPDSPFGKHYYRINAKIDEKHSDMANASKENIDALVEIGQRLVAENAEAIDRLCTILMKDK